MKEIEKVLHFVLEIDKLKDVYRKTKPTGLFRFENSAEHSWHVCISALMLKDFADDSINIDRVIKMLLVHDLGEIDADDVIVYQSENPEYKEKEAQGVKRVLSMLPGDQGQKYWELWEEFEEGSSSDARYARAIDRALPILHNIYGSGNSWKTHGISRDQVESVNKRIAFGSEELWTVIQTMLDEAEKEGLFPE